MRAVVQDRYGSTDALSVQRIDRPRPGDGEVLVRVDAAGVERGVLHLMTGRPYVVRLAGYGLRAPKQPVLGMEFAGVVVATGSGVTQFQPGDEVYGVGVGTYADYAVADADRLAPMPAGATAEQAAALASSGVTALQAVRDHAQVRAGQRVLVLGASGGVGTFAVQIAVTFGARVTGVCSTTKVDLVRSLGAEKVIDYTRAEASAHGRGYDVVIDIGGNRSLSQLRSLLRRDGTLVIVGGESGGRWVGGADRSLRALVLSPFVSQRLVAFVAKPTRSDLDSLGGMVETGAVTPVLDRSYPLAETVKALRYVDEGHARGKVVITVSADE